MTVKEKVIFDLERKIAQKEEELKHLKERLEEVSGWKDNYVDPATRIDEIPEFSHMYTVNMGLKREKIITVEDLVKSSPEVLLEVRGIGKITLAKIEEWMKEHDLSFIEREDK